jgi:hypothetical protein
MYLSLFYTLPNHYPDYRSLAWNWLSIFRGLGFTAVSVLPRFEIFDLKYCLKSRLYCIYSE